MIENNVSVSVVRAGDRGPGGHRAPRQQLAVALIAAAIRRTRSLSIFAPLALALALPAPPPRSSRS